MKNIKKIKNKMQNKSEIRNKNKRLIMQKEKMNCGEKIRDIQNDLKSQEILLGIVLVVSNLILTVVLILLACWVKTIASYIICFVLFFACVMYSVIVLIKSHTNYGYVLFQNCIKLKNVFDGESVFYKDILSIDVKITWIDKIFKKGTKTLQIKCLNNSNIKLFFVTEDTDVLIDEIKNLLQKSRNN